MRKKNLDVNQELKQKQAWNQVMVSRPYRSNRILQFATKVSPEFDQQIREIAFSEGIYMAELLEKCLEAYLYLKTEREREREQI